VVAHIIAIPKEFPDPREMGPYYEHVEETMARYSGGYQAIPRHRVTVLEGDWLPAKGVVILEFPSYEQALARYHSEAYAPLLALRRHRGRFDMILVDGLSADDTVQIEGPEAWEVARIAELEAEERRAAT
jgi:uncharacterized protein (DUF1330 family)